MSKKTQDKDFRCFKVSYLEFKSVEMDRALTLLFPRLKYDGWNNVFRRTGLLTIEDFLSEFLKNDERFQGFKDHETIIYKWLETDLLDLVNRGKPNQAVAAPRPLHGNTYKFKNTRHVRDFGASEQIYWMLYHARKGMGQNVRDALKSFFFKGYDFLTDKYHFDSNVDVETQAILHLDIQVARDKKDSNPPDVNPPLCIGNADIFADDIMRLLAYEPYVPRSVLVEYLKTLMAFHLSLYHLKLFYLLPNLVQNPTCCNICDPKQCPVNPAFDSLMNECPHQTGLIIEMGDPSNAQMIEMAKLSADRYYRQISRFVESNYAIKKLDELHGYLCDIKKINGNNKNANVFDLVSLLGTKHDRDRDNYFASRLARLVEDAKSEEGDLDPEVREAMTMDLDAFGTFIEILMAYRGQYHKKYITQCMDTLMLKNKDNGLLAQTRAKGSPRRFVIGSKLLEVLLQLAVLKQEGSGFVTREMRVEELLLFLRNRYGLYIDSVPESFNHISIMERRALRQNLEAFKRRIREIGFYEDLSDAFITQKISPRFAIGHENPAQMNRR